MTNQGKKTKISIRLGDEASAKLKEAKQKGYTTSQYIEGLINGSAIVDIGLVQGLMPHIFNLQTILEHEEDPEIRNEMREELHKICRYLRSLQNNM